jgi:hypothetical protein
MKKWVLCALLMLVPVMMLAQVPFLPTYEPPKEVTVPAWIMWIVNFFSSKWIIPFSAAIAGILITVVGVIRQLLAAFGTYLSAKVIYCVTLLLSFLMVLGTAASDGSLAGDEIVSVVSALLAFVGAIFGYRVIFSDSAKAKLKTLGG